jgi:hypothetical protein
MKCRKGKGEEWRKGKPEREGKGDLKKKSMAYCFSSS